MCRITAATGRAVRSRIWTRPDLKGPALVEQIRRIIPDIAVVYMTGYAEGAFEHHAGEDKSTRLINKPFSQAQLAQVLHDVMQTSTTQL